MWLDFPEDTCNINFNKMAAESDKIPQLNEKKYNSNNRHKT